MMYYHDINEKRPPLPPDERLENAKQVYKYLPQHLRVELLKFILGDINRGLSDEVYQQKKEEYLKYLNNR